MHPEHRPRFDGGAPTTPAAIALAVLVLVLSGPAAALAQPDPGQPVAAAEPGAAETDAQPDGAEPAAEPEPAEPLTFLDSVSVSATMRPAPVRDTPGMVSVIDDETIQERMIEDFADLVKYEPGVYVENNVTRLGLNGFNIRGIGGNRVMTLVDGVQTSEQFDFGPFNIHQGSLDVDVLKTVEIVRSANSALYGSDALGGVVSLFTKDPADYLRRPALLRRRQDDLGRPRRRRRREPHPGRGQRAGPGVGVRERQPGQRDPQQGHRRHAERHPHDAEPAGRRKGQQVLAKLVFNASPGNRLRTTAELYDTRVETDWLSNNRLIDFGRFAYHINESSALDTFRAPAVLDRPHPRRPRARPAVVAGVRQLATTPRRSSTRNG